MRKFVLAAVFVITVIAASRAESPRVPPENELRVLARDSLLHFNDAVQSKDFTQFHQQISDLWREQITPAKLKTIFQSFIEQEADLSGIANSAPSPIQRHRLIQRQRSTMTACWCWQALIRRGRAK